MFPPKRYLSVVGLVNISLDFWAALRKEKNVIHFYHLYIDCYFDFSHFKVLRELCRK